jgi:hypothetical protein
LAVAGAQESNTGSPYRVWAKLQAVDGKAMDLLTTTLIIKLMTCINPDLTMNMEIGMQACTSSK